MADPRSKAAMTLSEEGHRTIVRRRLLESAKRWCEEGEYDRAIEDVIDVCGMLSESEERLIRLHAECVALLEQTGKVLALDAARRPVQIVIQKEPGDE